MNVNIHASRLERSKVQILDADDDRKLIDFMVDIEGGHLAFLVAPEDFENRYNELNELANSLFIFSTLLEDRLGAVAARRIAEAREREREAATQ